MLRLGTLTVLIMAISISLAILSWSYFWHYQPDIDTAKDQTALAKSLHDNASTAPQAEVRKEKAQTQVAQVFEQWRNIVVNHAPPASTAAGGINLDISSLYMPVYAHQFRNSLQMAVNKQVLIGGVKVIAGPTVPDPGDSGAEIISNFFNYPAIPFPVVIFDLGQITVQGSYQQIKANVEAWASMPNYFAVADGLALNGTSPILTGTYSVSMIGYIRGKSIYPGMPVAAPTSVFSAADLAKMKSQLKQMGQDLSKKMASQMAATKAGAKPGSAPKPGSKAPAPPAGAKTAAPAGTKPGVAKPPAAGPQGAKTSPPNTQPPARRPGAPAAGTTAPAPVGGTR